MTSLFSVYAFEIIVADAYSASRHGPSLAMPSQLLFFRQPSSLFVGLGGSSIRRRSPFLSRNIGLNRLDQPRKPTLLVLRAPRKVAGKVGMRAQSHGSEHRAEAPLLRLALVGVRGNLRERVNSGGERAGLRQLRRERARSLLARGHERHQRRSRGLGELRQRARDDGAGQHVAQVKWRGRGGRSGRRGGGRGGGRGGDRSRGIDSRHRWRSSSSSSISRGGCRCSCNGCSRGHRGRRNSRSRRGSGRRRRRRRRCRRSSCSGDAGNEVEGCDEGGVSGGGGRGGVIALLRRLLHPERLARGLGRSSCRRSGGERENARGGVFGPLRQRDRAAGHGGAPHALAGGPQRPGNDHRTALGRGNRECAAARVGARGTVGWVGGVSK